MKPRNEDEFFSSLAEQYARQYGARLQQENEALARSGRPFYTPRMDERAYRLIRRRSNRRGLTFGLLAACLTLALVSYSLLQTRMAPGETATTPPLMSETNAPPGDPAVIPLSFTLPDNFEVSAVETDRGETIYSLSNAHNDDVVLILSTESKDVVSERTTEFFIGGVPVYGQASADYQMLSFQKEGIYYEMTCRYDINTLVALGESIL